MFEPKILLKRKWPPGAGGTQQQTSNWPAAERADGAGVVITETLLPC